jgi:glutamine amidotransferase
MSQKITIIDYGVSNLLNVVRAFEYCGASVELAERPEQINAADRLVLPGVGAFADGMAELGARGLIDPIRKYAATGRPFLGICLGMQMLLDESEEFGNHAGLGLIPGRVIGIPAQGTNGRPHKIPHIGWNELRMPQQRADWSGTVLGGLSPNVSVYFVHSFMAAPASDNDRLADCDYDGVRISAAVQSGNVYGCQFHPEKSGETGLNIVRSFIRL